MEKIIYKKGTHVVLLHSCKKGHPNAWDELAPINYVYRLKEDMTLYNFIIESSIYKPVPCGWSVTNIKLIKKEAFDIVKDISSLVARLATPEEIERYNNNNFLPVKADNILFL